MKCAIMQPTYLPWVGYMNMIKEVDVFVFLDDVQFSKRSWQQRNRIILNGKERYLTVPVLTSGKRNQLINEVKTSNDTDWKENHLQILKQAYGKHPYFKDVYKLLKSNFQDNNEFLCEININIIKSLMELLDIETKVLKSSDIPVDGKKSEYLFRICDYLGVSTYLSAPGSKEYIEKEGVFSKSNIEVIYHDFKPPIYNQKDILEYISHLSVIDLIANIGKAESKNYIKR